MPESSLIDGWGFSPNWENNFIAAPRTLDGFNYGLLRSEAQVDSYCLLSALTCLAICFKSLVLRLTLMSRLSP